MAGFSNSRESMAPTPEFPYPVRLSVEYPEEVSRLSTFFRLILAIPVLFFLALLSGSSAYVTRFTGARNATIGATSGVLVVTWVTILIRGEIPRWLFDFHVAASRFMYRAYSYIGLLTDQYPPFDGEADLAFDIDYPVHISRRRLIFWKIITVLPHIVVLFFLSLASVFVIFIAWWAILFTGTFPRGLHKFVVGVLRWGARVAAYGQSLTDVFPPYSLDEDAGPGGSLALSAVLGVALVAVIGVGAAAAAVAINRVSHETKSVQVSYSAARSGSLPAAERSLTLDQVTANVEAGSDPFTSDLVKPVAGHRLVSFTLGYTNDRVFRPVGHHDVELNSLRVRTDQGTYDAVLLTADGALAPINVAHGRRVSLQALFEITVGETITELQIYPVPTTGRHVAWEFAPASGATPSSSVANSGQPGASQGLCLTASFSIVNAPVPARVFHDSDVLSATVKYSAPGCKEIDANFGGQHVAGSPWFKYYCATCTAKSYGSNIPAGSVPISAPEGTVTVVGQPGSFPPKDLSSPPNLEGFQLCAVVLSASDGKPFGLRTSSQQINLPCPPSVSN